MAENVRGRPSVQRIRRAAKYVFAIIGAGSIGLVTLLSLRAMGVEEIALVDIFDNRLQKAKELGATYLINGSKTDVVKEVKESFGGLGPDYVFECAGNIKTASQTIYMVKRGGTVVIVGNVVGLTPINFQLCVDKNLTIRTTFRYCNVFPVAIEAIASGRINVKQIVSNEFDFKDWMPTGAVFQFCEQNGPDLNLRATFSRTSRNLKAMIQHKISKVDVHLVSAPVKSGFADATRKVETVGYTIVRITTDQGLELLIMRSEARPQSV
jgi:Zinc-binding dehydrogenase